MLRIYTLGCTNKTMCKPQHRQAATHLSGTHIGTQNLNPSRHVTVEASEPSNLFRAGLGVSESSGCRGFGALGFRGRGIRPSGFGALGILGFSLALLVPK